MSVSAFVSTACRSPWEISEIIFQPPSYPQHGLESTTLFPTVKRLHNEVLSNVNKFNYTIRFYCNNLSLFWYTSVELLSVITISLSVGIFWNNFHITLGAHQWVHLNECHCHHFSFWFPLIVIVKLQRLILIIIEYPKDVNKLISGSLWGI